MTILFYVLILLSVTAVLITLGLGMYTLIKRNQGLIDAQRSNKLMKWRVILQFIAILFIILAFFIKKQVG